MVLVCPSAVPFLHRLTQAARQRGRKIPFTHRAFVELLWVHCARCVPELGGEGSCLLSLLSFVSEVVGGSCVQEGRMFQGPEGAIRGEGGRRTNGTTKR
jgi:hypothetical protein